MVFSLLYRRTVAALGMTTMLLVISGCAESGPKLVPVSGKVTIDGKPLTYGYIRFTPTQGRTSDAQLNSDGTFTLRYSGDREGAVLGTHRVEIAANEVLGPSRVKWHAPKQYASIGTSKITQEITGPTKDLTIDLTWGTQQGPFEDNYKSSDSF
jgi:hypothetical protein